MLGRENVPGILFEVRAHYGRALLLLVGLLYRWTRNTQLNCYIGCRRPKSITIALMRSLRWNSSHAVFVTEIDDDHKEIFDAVTQLQAALSESRSLRDLDHLTGRLAVHLEDHFAHEERLMRAARYGLLSWHKRCHDAARKQVAQFINRIGRGDPAAGPALIGYLTEWLHNHTRLPDKMLGAFLRNHRRAGKMVFTVGTKAPGSCSWVTSRGEPFNPPSTE